MLTIPGSPKRLCDGISRRNFLQIGALGAGLTLADLLKVHAQTPGANAPGSPKSVIFVYMWGGPPHLDTYDMKPAAPAEFRGEFSPIATNVPGIQICELLPRQARMWDKLSVVRSVTSVDEHSDAYVMTGYSHQVNRTEHHPSIGAVISRLRGSVNDVPPYVTMWDPQSQGNDPGFLGPIHGAFSPRGSAANNLKPNIALNKLEDRKALLNAFDKLRHDIDASGGLQGMEQNKARAFDILTSGNLVNALDLNREPLTSRERYKGSENFLTARRLVEAGAGLVMFGTGEFDTHSGNFKTMRKVLPPFDAAMANLIQDLHDRGMQDDVVVIACGEFGRTPRINNNDAGRDHWSGAMSVVVSGGGLKMGQAIGATSDKGDHPATRRYTMQNVLSTVYGAIGINPGTTLVNQAGRPVYLLDDREPVAELI